MIEVGNINKRTKSGWLVGQFYPEGSLFKDQQVEICYKVFTAGDTSDKLHLHPVGKEFMIVLSGRAKVKFGDETVELRAGDYIAVESNTPERIVEVLEEFTVIGIRYPSIPDNKVLL